MLLESPRACFEIARAYRGLTQSDARAVAASIGRAKEDVSHDYFLCLQNFESHLLGAEDHIHALCDSPREAQQVIEELRIKLSSAYITPTCTKVLATCQTLSQRVAQIDTAEKRLQLQLALAVLEPLHPRVWFDLGRAYETFNQTVSALLSFAMSAYLTNGDLQLASETTGLFLQWEEKNAARALTNEVARDLIADPRYRKEGFALRESARTI